MIYKAENNEGYRTLDGIDVCGLRIVREIHGKITALKETGDVVKISIVGYSLGGLISRYVIGILYHQGLFKEIEPVNFTTFCTPHVGAMAPGSNISVRAFNWLVPNLLSLSGRQMFLKDNTGKEGPLLELMANKNSVFYRALQQFKTRILYANAINDKRTAWWTSGISIVDPFINIDESSSLSDLDYKYVESFAPVVLDAHADFKISNRPVSSQTVPEQPSNYWSRKYRWLVVALNLTFVMPLWVLWFIISGVMESLKSSVRIRGAMRENNAYFMDLTNLLEPDTDEATNDGSDIESIADKLDHGMEDAIHDRVDTLIESVWDAMTSKDEEQTAQLSKFHIMQSTEPYSSSTTTSKNEQNYVSVSISDLSYFSKDSPMARNQIVKLYTLELSPSQVEIVKNLNALDWNKFPILIRHTTSTHSAAIVRNINDPQLREGKVVVKHWLENAVQL